MGWRVVLAVAYPPIEYAMNTTMYPEIPVDRFEDVWRSIPTNSGDHFRKLKYMLTYAVWTLFEIWISLV